jgi:hypothetical protein
MKNAKLLILSLLIITGCGSSDKNPVGDDLDQIRTEGKQVTEIGPQKPVEVVRDHYYEKPVVVPHESATIDDKFIKIIPEVQVMRFNETQSRSYTIRATPMVDGVQINLTAAGLPAGATLNPASKEAGAYVLSWTPSLYTVPSNSDTKDITVKLTSKMVSAKDPKLAEKFKSITKDETIVLLVSRTKDLPSDLKVSGLPQEVAEGQEPITFTVTAKVPGIDDKSPEKPRLTTTYDGVSVTAGNNFVELDGSRYVILDINKKDAEYLGNFQWKFTRLFDVKNISVQPQLGKDGKIIDSSDGVRVRLSFKVYNNLSGVSTPEALAQVKIKYNKKISSPRFDLSGLNKKLLEVSRGENISLKFFVTSASSDAKITVSANSTLPGSPSVTCKDSPKGPQTQDCVMAWSVPCDATAASLAGQIDMTAVDSAGDPSSNTTNHSLQTKLTAKEKKLCAKPAAKEPVKKVK